MRVGKYSTECKTKEAVSMLYKQFEKFFWPTVPQQEERIQQIKEMAIHLLGTDLLWVFSFYGPCLNEMDLKALN